MERAVCSLKSNQYGVLSLENEIKDFYLLKQIMVNRSIHEIEEQGINVFSFAICLLKKYGFSLSNCGTYYIADVIEQIYYERKIFDEKLEYFNLDIYDNEHYINVCDKYECNLESLHLLIGCVHYYSRLRENSMNTLVYGIVKIISEQYDKEEDIIVKGPGKKYRIF